MNERLRDGTGLERLRDGERGYLSRKVLSCASFCLLDNALVWKRKEDE